MTVRRGFLYLGAFLVALGGVTLLAEAGVLSPDTVAAALGYWPLAVIAIGSGLILRRTRAAVPGGVVAAAVPGLLLGAMFVAVPTVASLSIPCTGAGVASGPAETKQGTLGNAARVELSMSCGDLAVTTAPGSDWRVDIRNGSGRRTDVTEGPGSLAIRSEERGPARFDLDAGGLDWDVALPTGPALDLDVEVNAGRGRLDLAGARLERLSIQVNAGDLRSDLTGTIVPRLNVDVNAAAAAVILPATGNMTGDLNVNAGSLKVCVPDDLGLRVRAESALGSTDLNGLIQRGNAWETPNYTTAPFHADLSVTASVGSVDVNPEGGCK